MPQYMITYLGRPKQMTPEEGQQHMSKYKEWLAALGESAISPANPIKNTKSISSDGSVTDGGASSMSGFTIIEAESENAAMVIAKQCPYLDVGGSLEVSEIMKMSS